MQPLLDCIKPKKGDCISLVGSGGKTSLLWYLAQQNRTKKVLVSTTTKMGSPPEDRYDRWLGQNTLFEEKAQTGISFVADSNQKGKVSSVPLEVLARVVPAYDLVLLEADGSRTLPLKGWAPYEPVVPDFTSCTIGLIPVWPLGRPASEQWIHRMPLFCELTGLSPGEQIAPVHLAAAIGGGFFEEKGPQRGLFTKAVGRRVLFFNQVEQQAAFQQAEQVVSLLPKPVLAALDTIVVGSVHQGVGRVL